MDAVGFHHFYIGLALILIGFLLLIFKRKRNLALVFVILGLYICGDDFYQHVMQLTDPAYRSPLNKLYRSTLGQIGFVAWLNVLIDKIFGR